jgi:hypothetical protein
MHVPLSPSPGLFLTCTQRIYFTSRTIFIFSITCVFVVLNTSQPSYLELWLLVRSLESPSLLAPCSESTAHFWVPHSAPAILCLHHISPSSCQYMQYLTQATSHDRIFFCWAHLYNGCCRLGSMGSEYSYPLELGSQQKVFKTEWKVTCRLPK